MFTIKYSLVVAILMIPRASSSLMETLLQPTLRAASCQARCESVARDQMEDCLKICSLVVEEQETELCNLPRFCTGGCRAACQSERREDSLASVSQQDCLLSWSMDLSPSNIVYVVVGLDQGGMLSIISDYQQDSRLPLTPEMINKYLEVTVIAVDGAGLLDMETISIQDIETCPLITPENKSLTGAVNFIEENFIHVCLVVIILIILLSFIIIKIARNFLRQSGRQAVEKQTLENLQGSGKFFLICQESLTQDIKHLNL